MTFHARLTELLENNKQGDIADGLKLSSFLFNHAEAIRDLVVAAEKVRHWHDAHDGGMIVSAESVRGLWEALAKLEEA